VNPRCLPLMIFFFTSALAAPQDAEWTDLPRNSTPMDIFLEDYERDLKVADLFAHEQPVLIIRASQSSDSLCQWESHTICWLAEVPGQGANAWAHESVSIVTRYYYGYDSGPQFAERGYWPVDIDGDEMDDLFVFGWSSGRVTDGASLRKLGPYDEPGSIRKIVRKHWKKAFPGPVESDETLLWEKALLDPQCVPLLKAALERCEDEIWTQRLKKALAECQAAQKGHPAEKEPVQER